MPDRSLVGSGGGRTDALLALVGEQARVGAGVAVVELGGEPADPCGVLGALGGGRVVDRRHVDHDPALAVGEGRGVRGHAGHRAAEHADLAGGHRRRRLADPLEDRLRLPRADAAGEHRARHHGEARSPARRDTSRGTPSAAGGRRPARPARGRARRRAGPPRGRPRRPSSPSPRGCRAAPRARRAAAARASRWRSCSARPGPPRPPRRSRRSPRASRAGRAGRRRPCRPGGAGTSSA